jgi:xylulokinase
MQLLLGIDVGTTAAKAAAFDEQGRTLATGQSSYSVQYPQPGWAEQEPEQLWQGVVAAVRQMIQQLPPNRVIRALGVSSQGATTILLDEQDQPLRPAISWMDMRAAALVPAIERRLGSEAIYRAIGWPFDAWLPLAHIAWLRQFEPANLARTRRVSSVDSYIKLRLCGRLMTDPTLAGATGLYDIANGDWQQQHLEYAGLSSAQLPEVAPSTAIVGELTREAAETLGLPASIPVINGAHDQICSVTAAGVAKSGQALVGTGTAWVIIGIVEQPVYDLLHHLTLEPHTIPGLWCPLRTQGGVGGAFDWLAQSLLSGLGAKGDRRELYANLNKQVSTAPPGAHGLVFLAPRRRPDATGHLLGLTLSHTVGDIGRALMEGIVCDLSIMANEMRAAGMRLESLIMTGGATYSSVWPSIVADMLGLPLRIPEMAEAGARGGAILAGAGSSLYPDVPAAMAAFALPGREILPNLANRACYGDLLARYQHLDRCLEQEYTPQAPIVGSIYQ